ncbi:MAG: class 3 adenylate cyclase [Candidatus Azotimanducaceae bacterium]|jgi:class 3 adenylate cyclase|tara:strand:- start:3501 stop:3662 length:162 start_codon:yes stop_codon:yes gene_type:complete
MNNQPTLPTHASVVVIGDGIMAMFGAPLASERHALEACRAAIDMRAAVSEYSA